MPSRPILLHHRGQTVRIRRSEEHPNYYLWITIDGAEFFLGVLLDGWTRGDVKAYAREWLRDREAKAANPRRRHR